MYKEVCVYSGCPYAFLNHRTIMKLGKLGLSIVIPQKFLNIILFASVYRAHNYWPFRFSGGLVNQFYLFN